MKTKDYKELKITGITILRDEDITHYFGYNDEGEVIKEASEPTVMFSLAGNEEQFKSFISEAVEDINILSWSDEYKPSKTILDGEEWKITLHIENYEDIVIHGMNAYPDNFVDFIILCNKYDFGPYDFIDEDDGLVLDVEEWYMEFLEEIEELEE